MRFARPALGAAIAGLAIAVAWYLRPAPQPTSEPENVVDRAPASASSSASLAIPPAAVAEAPSDAGSLPVAPAGAATVSAPTPTRAPLPGETPVMPVAQLMEGRHVAPNLLEGERKFAAEPVDATWAPGAEADLLGKLAEAPGLALTGLRVECRSTMCRMQLAVPRTPGAASRSAPFNFEQQRAFADSVGLDLAWSIGLGDTSGTFQSVTYLRRKGIASEPAR